MKDDRGELVAVATAAFRERLLECLRHGDSGTFVKVGDPTGKLRLTALVMVDDRCHAWLESISRKDFVVEASGLSLFDVDGSSPADKN